MKTEQRRTKGLRYEYDHESKTCYLKSANTEDSVVYIPSETPKGYKVIGIGEDAFARNYNIETVIISDGIEYIDNYAFIHCTNLNKVELPCTLKTIGGFAFFKCSSLTSITIPKTVEIIETNPFLNCPIENIVIEGNDNYKFINNCLISKDDTLISAFTASVIPDCVTTIGEFAFAGGCLAKTYTIPASVTKIDNYAFYSSSVESLVIPVNVENIGEYTFSTSNIKEVSIPGNVKRIDACTFENCSSLEKIRLPKTLQCIQSHAFSNCSSLSDIILVDNISEIKEFAFANCTSLLISELPDSIKTIERYAFCNCIFPKKILISTSIESIGYGAFSKSDSNNNSNSFMNFANNNGWW